jgi:asparagine synthase (glutamine-hydrolysing)
MCGIAGLINVDRSPVSPIILKKMTDRIAHRGPDGEGQWVEGNVGLGHRRLAIIDLSPAGHQPMISADHRYVLTYNGEIYNYRELRAELEAEGVWFRSQTDSEVVLYALAHWGTDALLKFNGMFALAFWDRKQQRLLLARDRYGIKPLYYAQQGNTLAFGSEQKAITVNPAFSRKLNKAALFEYFTFQNIFSEQTLLEDIHLLPAGTFGILELCDSGKPELYKKQYWDYWFCQPEYPTSKGEYVEELRRLFEQAVNRQLVSDVELGAYLSGGIDSGSIATIAAQQLPDLKTFTCGFDLSSASGAELALDERTKAEAMSARLKTEHYEIVLKSGDMERCLPRFSWHLEEPRVGQSYPNYYAAKLAGKFVKVVLSGSGGDELFGGYPWRYYRAAEAKGFDQFIDQYYLYWQRLLSNQQLKQLFKPVWTEVKDIRTRDIFSDVFSNHENQLRSTEDCINHSLYFEAKTFLQGLFIVEDKLSMSYGLETRVPFMDNDLVDFAMKCPVSLKLNQLTSVVRINENEEKNKREKYFILTKDGKSILREAMKSILPDDIMGASKQGFSAPDGSWFKNESSAFIEQCLLSNTSRINEFLCKREIKNLLGEHLEGKENRRLLVWSLLSVEHFLRSHL